MELTLKGIRNAAEWEAAGIALPSFEPEAVYGKTRRNPVWVHFGIGNIFRVFIGSIADRLIREGETDYGLICAETYDEEIVDRIYAPHDNLTLSVILNPDGTRKMRVLGCFAETVTAEDGTPGTRWGRLAEIFAAPSLQMASFTITEKGYALRDSEGAYTAQAVKDLECGPDGAEGCIAVVTSMLYRRFLTGAAPLALVSMDNCSRNGERLRGAVLEIAEGWKERGYVPEEFLSYVRDEARVAFPWTMIDKITPRPAGEIAEDLEALGVKDMQPVITAKKTFIAPFVNAEEPQYLVVEDSFPNGRPALEKAGVYMADRETVNKSERMKVTVCLNPLHTALCTYDCMLGYTLFADGMHDPELAALAQLIGYREGMAVVPDPGILSPKAFLDEVVNERFPNPYLGDTSQRIATDISQMVGIRFGETVKTYVERFGTAESLVGIPLAIAGWLRYLLAVDDSGAPMELAPDPMIPELRDRLRGVVFGEPESARGQLEDILSNAEIFGINLYDAGIGEKTEAMFAEEIAGPGAVRSTLKKYLSREAQELDG